MRHVFTSLALRIIIALTILGLVLPVYGQEDWKKDFEDICARVNTAHTLTVKELKDLINRADTLIKRLQKMDLKAKRLYIFRLKKCRSFYQYSLELKEKPD